MSQGQHSNHQTEQTAVQVLQKKVQELTDFVYELEIQNHTLTARLHDLQSIHSTKADNALGRSNYDIDNPEVIRRQLLQSTKVTKPRASDHPDTDSYNQPSSIWGMHQQDRGSGYSRFKTLVKMVVENMTLTIQAIITKLGNKLAPVGLTNLKSDLHSFVEQFNSKHVQAKLSGLHPHEYSQHIQILKQLSSSTSMLFSHAFPHSKKLRNHTKCTDEIHT